MALLSMTGFGRGTFSNEQAQASVEISSVNRKQAEIVISGLKNVMELEPRIRSLILKAISRGRVQCQITLKHVGEISDGLLLDETLATNLRKAFLHLGEKHHARYTLEAADFMRLPGIVKTEDNEWTEQEAWTVIEPALTNALTQFHTSRAGEGKLLEDDLSSRLRTLQTLLEQIKAQAPGRAAKQKDLMMKRLEELGSSVDINDDRIVKEIALFADRCDITEECTRLDAHFEKFHDYRNSAEPSGRALDFLCQEINREYNTIGSKANDSIIAHHVVAAKSELEKIREQVQNVE